MPNLSTAGNDIVEYAPKAGVVSCWVEVVGSVIVGGSMRVL